MRNDYMVPPKVVEQNKAHERGKEKPKAECSVCGSMIAKIQLNRHTNSAACKQMAAHKAELRRKFPCKYQKLTGHVLPQL